MAYSQQSRVLQNIFIVKVSKWTFNSWIWIQITPFKDLFPFTYWKILLLFSESLLCFKITINISLYDNYIYHWFCKRRRSFCIRIFVKDIFSSCCSHSRHAFINTLKSFSPTSTFKGLCGLVGLDGYHFIISIFRKNVANVNE